MLFLFIRVFLKSIFRERQSNDRFKCETHHFIVYKIKKKTIFKSFYQTTFNYIAYWKLDFNKLGFQVKHDFTKFKFSKKFKIEFKKKKKKLQRTQAWVNSILTHNLYTSFHVCVCVYIYIQGTILGPLGLGPWPEHFQGTKLSLNLIVSPFRFGCMINKLCLANYDLLGDVFARNSPCPR